MSVWTGKRKAWLSYRDSERRQTSGRNREVVFAMKTKNDWWEMVPVLKSPLCEFFEDDIGSKELESVYLLSPDEASRIWDEVIGGNARGLHDLPADSWLHRRSWRPVGNWINAYNGVVERRAVFDLVAEISSWKNDHELFLIQARRQILKFPFSAFRLFWPSMMAALDDGPLLVDGKGCAGIVFSFVPLGVIQQVMPLE